MKTTTTTKTMTIKGKYRSGARTIMLGNTLIGRYFDLVFFIFSVASFNVKAAQCNKSSLFSHGSNRTRQSRSRDRSSRSHHQSQDRQQHQQQHHRQRSLDDSPQRRQRQQQQHQEQQQRYKTLPPPRRGITAAEFARLQKTLPRTSKESSPLPLPTPPPPPLPPKTIPKQRQQQQHQVQVHEADCPLEDANKRRSHFEDDDLEDDLEDLEDFDDSKLSFCSSSEAESHKDSIPLPLPPESVTEEEEEEEEEETTRSGSPSFNTIRRRKPETRAGESETDASHHHHHRRNSAPENTFTTSSRSSPTASMQSRSLDQLKEHKDSSYESLVIRGRLETEDVERVLRRLQRRLKEDREAEEASSRPPSSSTPLLKKTDSFEGHEEAVRTLVEAVQESRKKSSKK